MGRPRERTYECLNCGTEFTVRHSKAKFCSRTCANLYRHSGGPNTVPKRAGVLYDCPHNKWVCCSDKNCGNCGWNPVVAKKRMEARYG